MRVVASTRSRRGPSAARASRYTPASVARPKRSSAVRNRRTSRLCRVSRSLRPEPRRPYCSICSSSGGDLGRLTLLQRAERLADHRLQLGHQRRRPVPGAVEAAGDVPPRLVPQGQPVVGGQRAGPVEVARRRGRGRRGALGVDALGHEPVGDDLGGQGEQLDPHAPAGDGDDLGHDLGGEQHEDGRRRRLLDGLEQVAGRLVLHVLAAVGDDRPCGRPRPAPAWRCAPPARRRPCGTCCPRARPAAGRGAARRGPGARGARGASSSAAPTRQQRGRERLGQRLLARSGRADEQVGVHRLARPRPPAAAPRPAGRRRPARDRPAASGGGRGRSRRHHRTTGPPDPEAISSASARMRPRFRMWNPLPRPRSGGTHCLASGHRATPARGGGR